MVLITYLNNDSACMRSACSEMRSPLSALLALPCAVRLQFDGRAPHRVATT